MTDHVAVLREMLTNTPLLLAEERAAIDHAIATCEQHAALAARLGELEKVWREQAQQMDKSATAEQQDVGYEMALDNCADDLARVVKENEGG